MKNLKNIPLLVLIISFFCLSSAQSAVQSARGTIHFEDFDFANEADYNDYIVDYQVSAHYQSATGKIYSFWLLINPKAAGATHNLELKVNKEFTDGGGFCELMLKDGTQDLPSNQTIYQDLSKAFINCPKDEYINTINGQGICAGQPAVIQCANLGTNPHFKLAPDANGDTLENLASRFIVLKNNTLNVEYKHDSQVNSMGARWMTPPNIGITTEKSHFFNLILKKDYEADISGVSRSMNSCDPRVNSFNANPFCNELIKSYFTNHHSRSLLLSDGDASLVNKRDFNPVPWFIKKNTGPGTYSATEGYNLLSTTDFIDMILEGSYARANRSGLCKFVDCPSFEPPGGTIVDQEGYACAGGCSDPSKTSESTCLAVGVCSDSAHTTQADCESAGFCIGGAFISNAEACKSSGNIWRQNNTWTVSNTWGGEPHCTSTDLYCASDKTCKSTTGANAQHCDDVSDCSDPSMSCLTDMRYQPEIGFCPTCDGSKVCTDNSEGSPCTSSEDDTYQEYDSSFDTCDSGLQCLTRLNSSKINGLEYTCTAIDSKLCTNNAHCPENYLCNCNDSSAAIDCTTIHGSSASFSVGQCYRNIWTYNDSGSLVYSYLSAPFTEPPVVEGDYCEFFVDSINLPSSTSGRYVVDYFDMDFSPYSAEPVNSSELVYGCIDSVGYNHFSLFPNFIDCPYNLQGAGYIAENGAATTLDATHSTYTPYQFHWYVQVPCTDGSSCVRRDPSDNFKMCTAP